ncbi:hypothetical protein [Actinacidiphila alni]|uniref:hypothetical protein n=1 Tax=Actinacidiphila alni TaxID=380248 RepID=UPI0034546AA0
MLLPSGSGRPGTTGDFGSGMGPIKGEMGDDCPAEAKDIVAELYRVSAPRAVQYVPPHKAGVDPGDGPTEQLVSMPREQAARYMALRRDMTASCPQTTVTAVGHEPIAPQTVRFRLVKAELGDEAFIQESTTWDGDGDVAKARPTDGVRAYMAVVRLGGVVVIYGEFPTKEAALAAGTKAAAHTRTALLRTAAG